MKKSLIVVVILILAFAVPVYAEKPVSFQLTLMTPIQLFPKERDIKGLRLNMFYGTNHDVSGLDLGVFNIISNNGAGVQAALMMNEVDDMKGLQANSYH